MCRLKSLPILVIICICGFACPLHAQEDIPVGTVVAIVLDHTLDSRKSRPKQRIVARVAQEVPLDDKHVIRVQSKVFGEITEVENGLGQATLGLRFDCLELGKAEVAISARIRALASALNVDSAKAVDSGGSQYVRGAETTVQIGGDVIVYRGGGAVENEKGEVVGKPVYGGVLATVTNPAGSKCEGIPVSKTPQAIWLFSPRACGVYGFRDLQFENGTNAKAGEILFTRKEKKEWKQTNIELPAGSALLLAITGVPPR
jgi:hypothetical protein